jgi:hypothetical protein
MDRWVINRIVPSEAGLFQIWVKEGSGLSLVATELSFYGGLRNTLRETIDRMAPSGTRLRKLINGRESWFRFSISPAREYLEDLSTWFKEKDGFINKDGKPVMVFEKEVYRKFPSPPEDIQAKARKRLSEGTFTPPLPPK